MIEPTRRFEKKLPSNRAMGFLLVFAGLMYSAWSYRNSRIDLAIYAAFITSLFLITTIVLPKALYPFNRAWNELGILLGKIFSPIVLGLLFLCIITPVAVITRTFGRDPLHLKSRPDQKTFWIVRPRASNLADSFKNQF